ncbi:DEAD/DEAH box helicase [Phytoactinopolyspora endophytica]|uniref:DEAD/DEAH box helicase n=1 Tax=Phytoactinopolyspora endophytica TaxID=1642495 RepID=UPI0013EB922B|nr:DEAD/DEAH box helicase [Phytoactinopolyspora endophytica]
MFESDALEGYLSAVPVPALFPAQMAAIAAGATLDDTRVIALPTSSGKTFIAELRIVATLTRNPGTRAIYVAPYRLLSRQVERQLRPGLRAAGLAIRDLGSGYDPSALPSDDVADVIVCTPERLDGLMRLAASSAAGHTEAADFLDNCSVLVFDELHLIGRPGRGPRFELILARLRMRNPDLKLLGLAAATHGSQELSEWLGDEPLSPRSGRPTGTLELVWETDGTIKQRAFQANPSTVMSMPRRTAIDDAAVLLLRLNDEYMPALAICVSRPRAESLAKKVLKGSAVKGEQWRTSLTHDQWRTVLTAIEEVRALLGENHPLAQMMNSGIAFHHAGVPTHALEQIERLVRRGLLRVVCATTTVAEGADMPFRVVVIPHLNFPGPSRRLERDLYLNIIGRAGRANVAVEGMVFILDSDSKMLSGLVRNSLWQTSARDVLRGQLNNVSLGPATVEEWNDFADIESQVLAWLTDPSSYVEGQALALSEQTFSYDQGNNSEKQTVTYIVDQLMCHLETDGYAVAGSPLRATARGSIAQLTGLSLPAVHRLSLAVERGRDGWMSQLPGTMHLTSQVAELVARMTFEAPEVFQHGLWFRRNAKAADAWDALSRFAYQADTEHLGSTDHELDIQLFTDWLMGASYARLAEMADVAQAATALFGGQDESKRISDATEYIGKLVYPASWVWSGAQIVAGELGDTFPSFIRGAIEYGVPNETCVQLIERGRLTRRAALTISGLSDAGWDEATTWLLGDGNVDDAAALLTRADGERLRDLRDALEFEE